MNERHSSRDRRPDVPRGMRRGWPARAPSPVIALLGATALAGGCAARTHDTAVPFEAPEAFSRSGEAPLPDRWWTAFGDPALDRLVDEALRSNLDLEAAWHRLRAARAIADRESALLSPALDVTVDAARRRPDAGAGGELQLGLAAGYEVDLWGRIGARADAERLRARASLADYRTAALSLSAEVARTWYERIEAQLQLDLLAEQVETNETVLRLLENRVGTGQTRGVDVLRQRELVEATREQRWAAEARVAVLQHQLAVLLGRPPRAEIGAEPPPALPALPPPPRTGLPGELVDRRPDVRRSWNELLAADRDLAAAISERYPRLTLTGSLATEDGPGSALFEDWFRSLVGSLVGPLFDGGERAAEVERTRAARRQRLFEYGQTTLLAFREVEDALVEEAKQRQRLRSLERQSVLARRTLEQLRLEYLAGLSDYLDVLVALGDEQELRRELLAARRGLIELRIALYRALAGGFGTEREKGAAVRTAEGPS